MKKYKATANIGEKKYSLVESFLNDRDFYEKKMYSRRYLSTVFLNLSQNKPIKIQPRERLSSSLSNLRDRKIKFDLSLLNSRINNLERKVNFIEEYTNSFLESSADLEKSLESEIEELELRYFEKADNVHVNNFTKEKDKSGFRKKNVFRTDFKTLMPFEKKDIMESFFNIGVSFPVKSLETYDVANCIILDEKTNVGDTLSKVFTNQNPFDIFRKSKIFRYALIKRNKDTTSRSYKRKTQYNDYPYNLTPTLTLKIDLESYVSINYLKISPVSLQGFKLNKLSYKKDGSYINVIINEIEIANKFYVFFESFSSSEIILEFEQRGCIENNKVVLSDKASYYLNEALRGGGFVSRVEENYEEITGFIYDLSLKHIEIGKVTFKNKGLIYSKPINVENFLSSKTKVTASNFGDGFFVENYLGIHLNNDEDSLMLQEMVPLPDSKDSQNEYLELRENIGRVKLYPDINKNLNKDLLRLEESSVTTDMDGKIEAQSIDFPAIQGLPSYFLGITPERSNNGQGPLYITLKGEDQNIFISYRKDYLVNLFSIEENAQKDGYRYLLNIDEWEEVPTESKAIEYFKKYNIQVYYYDNENAFFKVYEDETELVLGEDYEYSLDSKSSWITSYPERKYFLKTKDEKIAGSFYIKILNPNPEKQYSVIYDIEPEQTLVKDKQVYLINEKIKLGREYRENYGYIQNIIICRNSVNDSEEVSLIERYQNVIYENEIIEKKKKKIDLEFTLEKSKRGNLI